MASSDTAAAEPADDEAVGFLPLRSANTFRIPVRIRNTGHTRSKVRMKKRWFWMVPQLGRKVDAAVGLGLG